MQGLNLEKLNKDYVDTIFLSGVPVPPSDNQQYSSIVKRSREGKMKVVRASSKTAVKYKKQFSDFCLVNMQAIIKARNAIKKWDAFIDCQLFLAMEKERIVTVANVAKKNDVQNRQKLLIDQLSAALGFDDRLLSVVTLEKITTVAGSEQVIVILKPKKLRSLADLYASIDLRIL